MIMIIKGSILYLQHWDRIKEYLKESACTSSVQISVSILGLHKVKIENESQRGLVQK